jgi:hypothetical protein
VCLGVAVVVIPLLSQPGTRCGGPVCARCWYLARTLTTFECYCFFAVANQILAEMEPVHLADLVGREWIFVTMHDAVQHCASRMAERVSSCLNCTAPAAKHEEQWC